MSDSEKPKGDLADSDAVVADESGDLRVVMETLKKHGGDGEGSTNDDR